MQAPSQAVRTTSYSNALNVISSDFSSSEMAPPCRTIAADVHRSQGSSPSFSQVVNQPASKASLSLGSEEGNKENKSTIDFRMIIKEELASCERRLDDAIHASLTGFSIKLGHFLHEVFKINLLNEGAKERSLLLISLLRNAFGQEVSEVLQGEWLPACTAVSDQGPALLEVSAKTCVFSSSQLKKAAGSKTSKGSASHGGSSLAQSPQLVSKICGQPKGQGKARSVRKKSQ
jgi:hypothetical protein